MRIAIELKLFFNIKKSGMNIERHFYIGVHTRLIVKFCFYECVNIKLVTWEPGLTRNFFWHPYDETLGKALRSTARILYGRNGQRLKALQEGAIPLTKLGGRLVRSSRPGHRATDTSCSPDRPP